jgi:anion-transporting  ArsA/GET3 family ATPase
MLSRATILFPLACKWSQRDIYVMGKEKRRAKRLIEELREVDKEIAKSQQAIEELKSTKAKFMADVLTESSDTKMTSLGDLLTKDQIQAVVDILNRTNIDEISQTKMIKDYLRQFDAQLQAKGVIPDYLAYVLIHQADQIRAMAAMWN